MFKRFIILLCILCASLPGFSQDHDTAEFAAEMLPSAQGHWGASASYLPKPPYDAALEFYINYYKTKLGIKGLERALNQAHPYKNFIMSKLTEYGLPHELFYLPIIESAYRINAVSHAGALGIWQFMDFSGISSGLRINDWYDERMDFWKSTEAALQDLKLNYELFGDWYLALAAYNLGRGGVSKIVRETGMRNFWTLKARGLLPVETAHYIPKFLAVVRICSNPGAYGMQVNWEESPHWTRIQLSRRINLEIFAKQADIPLVWLKTGNAELKGPVTPGDQDDYRLKIPEEYAEQARQILADPRINLLGKAYQSGQAERILWENSDREQEIYLFKLVFKTDYINLFSKLVRHTLRYVLNQDAGRKNFIAYLMDVGLEKN